MDISYLKIEIKRIRAILEPHFSAETSITGKLEDPPSKGHCAVVAIILNSIVGGQIVSTKINGKSHWFNFCGDYFVDLTGDQFGYPSVQISPDLYKDLGFNIRSGSDINKETRQRARELAIKADLPLEGYLDDNFPNEVLPNSYEGMQKWWTDKTPEQYLRTSVRFGILNPDGTLTSYSQNLMSNFNKQ